MKCDGSTEGRHIKYSYFYVCYNKKNLEIVEKIGTKVDFHFFEKWFLKNNCLCQMLYNWIRDEKYKKWLWQWWWTNYKKFLGTTSFIKSQKNSSVLIFRSSEASIRHISTSKGKREKYLCSTRKLHSVCWIIIYHVSQLYKKRTLLF